MKLKEFRIAVPATVFVTVRSPTLKNARVRARWFIKKRKGRLALDTGTDTFAYDGLVEIGPLAPLALVQSTEVEVRPCFAINRKGV